MLVNVTVWFTEFFKFWVVCCIFHNVDCKLSVNLKPLRSFTPLSNVDLRCHVLMISASPIWPIVIKSANIAILGSHYVAVDESEIIERDARFGYKNKPFIGDIQQRISKESSFSIAHTHLTPLSYLQGEMAR